MQDPDIERIQYLRESNVRDWYENRVLKDRQLRKYSGDFEHMASSYILLKSLQSMVRQLNRLIEVKDQITILDLGCNVANYWLGLKLFFSKYVTSKNIDDVVLVGVDMQND